jgi:ribosomal protein S12 methylthiotransferase
MNIHFVSLGCSKNQVDSERVMGLLESNGHTMVASPKQAEAIFVNTCGFINPAKEESIATILEMADYKQHRAKKLIVIGCLAQRYKADLEKELHEVDRFIGVSEYHRLGEILTETLGSEIKGTYGKMERLIPKSAHSAYLKVSEGCSNRCTYCAIPLIRGNMKSYPVEELVAEAKKLAASGIQELVLIAQDTSRYHEDQGENRLGELLSALNAIEGITWIRLLYQYPNAVTPRLLAAMKAADKVVPYFDIPIQHADDELLKRMNRKGSVDEMRCVIADIRAVFPNATLRTTVIVGFPGETRAQFESLLDFIREIRFDHLGAFAYSPEEDTPAYAMAETVSETEKQERLLQVMDVQAEIAAAKKSALVQTVQTVLIEKVDVRHHRAHGRCAFQAPDQVDGEVIVDLKGFPQPGDFVKVRITGHDNYDLFGEPA